MPAFLDIVGQWLSQSRWAVRGRKLWLPLKNVEKLSKRTLIHCIYLCISKGNTYLCKLRTHLLSLITHRTDYRPRLPFHPPTVIVVFSLFICIVCLENRTAVLIKIGVVDINYHTKIFNKRCNNNNNNNTTKTKKIQYDGRNGRHINGRWLLLW